MINAGYRGDPILVLRFEAGSEEELAANRAEVEAIVAEARAAAAS